MSDIGFDGLGAFIMLLVLIAILGVLLFVSIIKLVIGRKKWNCHPYFGFLSASFGGILLTLLLMYIIEVGCLSVKEFMDTWSPLITILVLSIVIIVGFWYRKKVKNTH